MADTARTHPITCEIGRAQDGTYSLILVVENMESLIEASALGDALTKPFQKTIIQFFGGDAQFVTTDSTQAIH